MRWLCPQKTAKYVVHIKDTFLSFGVFIFYNMYFVFGRFYVDISSNLKCVTIAWCVEWVTVAQTIFLQSSKNFPKFKFHKNSATLIMMMIK